MPTVAQGYGVLASAPKGTSNECSVLITHHMFLEIGGVTIALGTNDPEFKIEADRATKKFLIVEADPEVQVEAKWGDLVEKSDGKKIFDSGALWQLYSEDLFYRFHFTSPTLGPIPYKMARFDREFSLGEIYLHHPYFLSGQPLYPLDYPLDEILIANILAQGKGLEIHACGVVDSNGNGHLFVGQSGAGKTTMARIWQNEPRIAILSDDRIILRQVENKLWMYGTPWHGEAELASPDRAPLTGVYFLSKGIRNDLIPLRESDTAARLFACSFLPFYSQPGIDFTLSFLEEVAKSVPCYELSFLPDKNVLKIVMSNED